MNDAPSHLQSPIPEGRRAEWAEDLARVGDILDTTPKLRLFLFRIGAEWFGLEPSVLFMTLPDARPRRLPHHRDRAVEGLVTADGRVITCLSLPRLLGTLPGSASAETRRLLVFHHQKWLFAARIDEARGVESLDEESLRPLPHGSPDFLRACAKGLVLHQNLAVVCLDAENFARHAAQALR